MNEFKQLCERVLEIPAPARATSAQMLALARHSARRRARLRVLLCTLVAGAVSLPLVWVPSAGPPPVAEPAQWAQMPPPETVASHSRQAADAVERAVPAPLISPSWTVVSPDGQRRALRLLFYSEGKEGSLIVYFQHTEWSVADGDDLCAPEVGAEIVGARWGEMDLCYEATVNGQPIRVTVGETTTAATRFLIDGFVTVVAREGTAVMLTPRQVAQIAADPDILPRPVDVVTR
ncbi:hypothetical protein [Allorhizocola rhizosphaerae]|uniref:hypothetical protein n=1 Tax=Allorhizocola rhizosphaerae TaxID=1872709 RepID=UPI000E3DF2A0|nr:hypothetical protein [Allorhizocola rhizosphaerae]